MDDWIGIIIKLVGVLAIIGIVVGYTYYVWDDCLDENSFITCARMLNK